MISCIFYCDHSHPGQTQDTAVPDKGRTQDTAVCHKHKTRAVCLPPLTLTMMNMLISAALTLTLAAAFSTAVQQDCREFPNYNTGLYTYTVCLGAPQVTDLDTTQTFCQQEFNSEVIEFRSEQEYNFIMSELGNGTISEGFSFITGFLQRKSDKNRFKPQTGEFYWLSEPDVIITSNSTTYWEPFRRLVEEFSGLALNTQYSKSFVVDLKGAWFPGSSFSK